MARWATPASPSSIRRTCIGQYFGVTSSRSQKVSSFAAAAALIISGGTAAPNRARVFRPASRARDHHALVPCSMVVTTREASCRVSTNRAMCSKAAGVTAYCCFTTPRMPLRTSSISRLRDWSMRGYRTRYKTMDTFYCRVIFTATGFHFSFSIPLRRPITPEIMHERSNRGFCA